LIFKCVLQPEEIIALQKYLPADGYCMINFPQEKIVYGIMSDELHTKFMDIVSGETLQCLEYLDEEDLRKVSKDEKSEILGNKSLIDELLF